MIYGPHKRNRPPHKMIPDEWSTVHRDDGTSYLFCLLPCNTCGKYIVMAKVEEDDMYYPYDRNGKMHSCKKTEYIKRKYKNAKDIIQKQRTEKAYRHAIDKDD